MVIAGKKGQNVRREVRIRISTPTGTRNGIPQTRGSNEQLSGDFFRLVARLLAGASIVILVLSQLLHWYVAKETAALERLLAINSEVRQKHAQLTAQRDELASKPRIVASAAAKLGLHLPTTEQEHRLE